MGENDVWSETRSLLNTVVYDQSYIRRYSFVPPNVDVSKYVQAPFNFFLVIENAKVALPDSVLKELEFHTSKLKECLPANTESCVMDPSMVVKQYRKICCALEELGNFLSEKILFPALRGHYPSIEERSK